MTSYDWRATSAGPYDEVTAEDARWGGDDDADGFGRSPVASQAEEEEDELEKLFGVDSKKQKRDKQSEAAITADVLNFLARMEAWNQSNGFDSV